MLLRAQQRAVLARDAERVAAVEVEQRDQVRVDRAEHHVDDLEVARRRDTHTVDELRPRMAHLLECARDLGTATVHDDRLQTDRAQQLEIDDKTKSRRDHRIYHQSR